MRTNPIFCSAVAGAALLFTTTLHANDLVWIGGTGNWNIAGNWNPPQIPTAADNVWITNNGTYTVTVPAGSTATNNSLTLGSASGSQTLAVDRATLNLNGASIVNPNGQLSFLVAQSVVTGPGSLTVNGTLNWADGTLSGIGTVTIGSTGVLAIGSGGVTMSRTINNGGAATWAGGNLTISANNTFNNLAGATFDITADGRLSGAATTPINNSGFLRLISGTTGTIITAPVNNNGSVYVLSSILNLNLGGTHNGIFSNAPGATLNFGGGSHTLSASSFVTGAGTLNLSGAATLAANGPFDTGTTLSLTAGTATLAAECNVTGTTVNLVGTGGALVYNSSSAVASLNLSAGTLGGSSPITVTGALTLGGGTITNAFVSAQSGFSITGNTTLNGTKLVNPVTAIWSGGNVVGLNGAVISNLLSAVFINSFDGNMNVGSGTTPMFINGGTFQKTNGTAVAGATSIDFQFFNTGTVEVQTNTLRYALNQQTAGLTLLDGGALAAQAQPLQFLGGSLVGTGAVTVANTMNVVNSSSISPGLPLGELDITGNYQQTSSGTLNIALGGYTAGKDFDLVTVTAGAAGGVATLGGTLNVTLTNGFSPTNGASFTFLTAVTRAGNFTTFNYPSNDIGMQLSIDPVSASVKVTNLKPVVANPIVSPAAGTYGSAFTFQFPANTFSDPDGNALTYTATGMPAGIGFNGSTRTFSGAPAQAGVFQVTVSATDNGTPSLTATNAFTLTVNPAPLSVAAQPQSKSYGAADPALAFTTTGLQLSDTAASVLTGALTRAAGETVAGSPYAITQGTLLANSNYTLSFTGSTLTITPATLAVNAQSKSKTYGTTDPALTFTVTGLQFSDSAAFVLTGNLTRVPGETVTGSPYSITQGTVAANANYNISFTPSSLTITPAPLTVTAISKSKTYGATLVLNGTSDFTSSGLLNGETIGSVTLSASGSPAGTAATAAAGSYSITPSAATGGTFSSANYSITYTAGTLTVNKAALSVTADAKSKTYGSSDPAFTVSYSGFLNGDTPALLGGTLGFARVPGENVGNYSITPSGLTSTNYNITFNAGQLTITQAILTVTADAKSKSYGSTDPALTFSVTGLQFSDTQASVLTGTLTRATGETVAGSPYAITQGSLAATSNYSISFTGNNLTITKAALSVTADAKSKTYGSVDPAFTATYSGFMNGETPAVLGGTLVFTRAPGENTGAYLVTPSGLTSSNYALTFNTGTLTITKATLTVVAAAKTKTYGSPDPALTFAVSGLQFSDTQAPVLTGALARTAGETVGPYSITQGTLAPNSNYTITFTASTLNIAPATLTIVADPKSKTYGAADPAFTFTATGFQFSDTEATVLTGSLARTAGETVAGSPYAITQGTLAANSNYSVSFSGSTLTITKAPLSVTANSPSKIYGSVDPSFTVSYSGFVNGETSAVLGGALTFTRAPGENVGSYSITPSGLTSGNYSITFNTGTLSITKAVLSVVADAITKTYGSLDPVLTFRLTGLQFTDTASGVLTGVLTRVGGESVPGSPYTITQGTLTPNGNYTISFTGNSLTITKAPLTVTADAKAKVYGSADPSFTVSYSGFVNGETTAVLGGTLTITRAAGENVGTYAITPAGLTSSNYAITFSPGILTITKATLTLVAQAKSKTYGAPDPTLTFTVSGFQFSDTQATVLSGALARAAGETVPGSPYAITEGTLAANTNYTINFAGSTLTITPAPLSITADSKIKVYGTSDPSFTVTFTGFVNGETSNVLTGTLSLTRQPGQNVGSYLITPSGLTDANYAITFNTGTLTITKAPLSVTADSKTKIFGTSDPTFTASYVGFVNGDTVATLGGTLVFTRAPGEIPGTYPITPSGLTSTNYTLTFNTGTLTIIAPAPQILSIARSGTTNLTLTWSAVSNGNYRVQFKTDLNGTNWTDLAGDVLANSGTASKTDLFTTTNHFYRIQVIP